MSTATPIVTSNGTPRPYIVSVSGKSTNSSLSWHGYWSFFKVSPAKDTFLSDSKYRSFDLEGNALAQNNAWVKIKFPVRQVIRRIKWQNGYSLGQVRRFTFQGSNDDINWVDLPVRDTVSETIDLNNPELRECVFDNITKYEFYRFVINEVHPWDAGNSAALYAVLEKLDLCDSIINAEDISVVPASLSLETEAQERLFAIIEPENATYTTVTWVSSDRSVAAVNSSSGLVTGLKPGAATITAVSEHNQNIRGICRVTVGTPSPDKVTGVRITNSPQEVLTIGSTYILNADVLPQSAENKEVTWVSSKPSVVSVTGVDKTAARLTAKSPGTAAITARSVCNITESAGCIITAAVKPKVSIEVGHGGEGANGGDPGNICYYNGVEIRESNIALEVSKALKVHLERHGVEVLISRDDDVPDWASDFFENIVIPEKPDVGISVHVNAGRGNGFECYYQTNEKMTESKKLCNAIADEVNKIPQDFHGAPVKSPTESGGLNGKNIENLINQVSGAYAYCELGYMDNPEDYARFDTALKQQNFGKAYAKGILNYLGITWKD